MTMKNNNMEFITEAEVRQLIGVGYSIGRMFQIMIDNGELVFTNDEHFQSMHLAMNMAVDFAQRHPYALSCNQESFYNHLWSYVDEHLYGGRYGDN